MKTIFSQAIPKLIGGHFFVLAVGKDVTLNGSVQNDPFFSGKSHSGRLVVEMLRTLRSWEYDFGELQPIPYDLCPPFPFVDLYTWLRRRNLWKRSSSYTDICR